MKKGKTIHDHRYRELIRALAEERVRLGVSQQELAEAIGLNQSDISKVEKYERRLDVLELSLVLSVLRVRSNIPLQSLVVDFLGLPE